MVNQIISDIRQALIESVIQKVLADCMVYEWAK